MKRKNNLRGFISTPTEGKVVPYKVELFTGTGVPIALTASNLRGAFKLTLTSQQIDKLKDSGDFVIQVSDGGGKKEKFKYTLKNLLDGMIEVELGKRFKDSVPAFKKLGNMTGRIGNDEVLELVREAVGLIAEPKSPDYNRLLNAALCPLPPLFFVDDLLDVASAVINGRFTAEGVIRDTMLHFVKEDFDLARSIGKRAEKGELFWPITERSTFLEGESSCPGNFESLPQETLISAFTGVPSQSKPGMRSRFCPINREAYLTVAAAVLKIGRTKTDVATLYAGFHRGLCGLDKFERVAELSYGALESGDPGPLSGLLKTMEMECGPDDGPVDWPPKPPGHGPKCPEQPDLPDCLQDPVRCVLNRQRPIGERYQIDSLSPAKACPGDTIVITGENFGSEPGQVCFSGPLSITRPNLCVDADSWNDNRIEVTVPERAINGEVRLLISDGMELICGHYVPVYKSGNSVTLEGGAPVIQFLCVNGNLGYKPVCVRPDEPFRISWSAASSPTGVTLTIKNENNRELFREENLGPSGSRPIHITDTGQIQYLTARLEATTECGSKSKSKDIRFGERGEVHFEGVEITQGLQYYHASQHLTDSNDRGADNSLTLVARKAAWVRVYLRSGLPLSFNGGRVEGVTGTMQVERIVNGQVVQSISRQPQNPGRSVDVEASLSYAGERGDINASLNFIVPGWIMRGRVRIRIEFDTGDSCIARPSDVVRTFDITRQQRLRIAGIPISYNGPDATNTPPLLTLNAPVLADFWQSAQLTYTMFPVAAPRTQDIRNAGTVALTFPLNDNCQGGCNGGCSPNWISLNNLVATAAAQDGNRNNWVYYGLLPNGVPMGPVVGCESGGVASGTNGAQRTMAHEVGHAVGLQHGPCGGVGTSADANFPAYEPYDGTNIPATPGGRIGEYGLDIRDGTIFTPNTRDVMGYCNTNWISLYHFGRVIGAAGLVTNTLPAGNTGTGDNGNSFGRAPGGGSNDSKAYICLIGKISGSDDEVEINYVGRFMTSTPNALGQETALVAELLEDEKVLTSAAVLAFDSQAQKNAKVDNQATRRQIQAFIPNVKRGTAIRIRHGETEIWRVEAPETSPRIEIGSVDIKKGRLRLTWNSETSTDTGRASVRWSKDGEVWSLLAMDVKEKADLNVGHLPSGKVLLHMMISDGFDSAVSEPVEIKLPKKEKQVQILHPEGTVSSPRSGILYLSCILEDNDEHPEDVYQWYIDGEAVASGMEAWIQMPEAGTHEVSVEVETAEGKITVRQKFNVEE